MSNALLPELQGQTWPRHKAPRFKTDVQTSSSMRRWTVGRALYPVYTIKITYSYLSQADLTTMMGFFNQRRGRLDSFLFDDRDDRAVTTPQTIGMANGVTKQFQLVRSLGGFVEPVTDLNGPALVNSVCYFGTCRTNKLRWSRNFANAVWGKVNCTAADDTARSPAGTGGNNASTITRTAAGNHYLYQYFPMADSSNKAFTASVVLAAGSMTGTVQLRLRDAAGVVEFGSVSVTLTGAMTRFSVSGTAPANSGAGVIFYIDPNNNTGVSGDTFFADLAQLEDGLTASTGVMPTNDVNYDYTITDGVIKFTSAALITGYPITWTGAYYWRVNFTKDEQQYDEFLRSFWELKTLEIETYKP